MKRPQGDQRSFKPEFYEDHRDADLGVVFNQDLANAREVNRQVAAAVLGETPETRAAAFGAATRSTCAR